MQLVLLEIMKILKTRSGSAGENDIGTDSRDYSSGSDDDNDGFEQGWSNLGIGEERKYDNWDEDDFHSYKSIKNDIINLFNIIVA
ncbi:unnamed protein product [[Candida] boidinii]|nr:unnamed protein product [[Candida] boidinii]